MRRSFAGLCLVLLGAAACGGRSREPETGKQGVAGSSGADACAAGKQTYQQKRSDVLQTAAASGCKQDAECGLLYESNACRAGCGVPLPVSAVDAAAAQLSEVASAICSSCPPMPIPPCVPPGQLKCVEGRCSEGP